MRRWRVIYKEEVGVFRASHFEAEDECALWDMIEASGIFPEDVFNIRDITEDQVYE